MKSTHSGVLLTALASIALGGCGGGSDDAPATAPSVQVAAAESEEALFLKTLSTAQIAEEAPEARYTASKLAVANSGGTDLDCIEH